MPAGRSAPQSTCLGWGMFLSVDSGRRARRHKSCIVPGHKGCLSQRTAGCRVRSQVHIHSCARAWQQLRLQRAGGHGRQQRIRGIAHGGAQVGPLRAQARAGPGQPCRAPAGSELRARKLRARWVAACARCAHLQQGPRARCSFALSCGNSEVRTCRQAGAAPGRQKTAPHASRGGGPAAGSHPRRPAGAQPRRAAAGAPARPARSPAPRPAPRTRRSCSRAGSRPRCRWPCACAAAHTSDRATQTQKLLCYRCRRPICCSARCPYSLREQRLCASEHRALSTRRSGRGRSHQCRRAGRGRAREGGPADRRGDVPDVVQVRHGRAKAVRAGGGARCRAAVQACVRVVHGRAQDLAQRDRGRKRAELLRAGGRRADRCVRRAGRCVWRACALAPCAAARAAGADIHKRPGELYHGDPALLLVVHSMCCASSPEVSGPEVALAQLSHTGAHA